MESMTLEERIAELEAENAVLQEQVTVLAERLHELEARLAKEAIRIKWLICLLEHVFHTPGIRLKAPLPGPASTLDG
jgi:hypothetical protein